MEGLSAGLGAGLAALAFWGFIAAVVVAGIWYGLRERQAQYETLSRMIESGQKVDEAIVDKVLGGNRTVDRDLKIAGSITIFVAPGLAVLGWFISKISEDALYPLLGTSILVAFVGVGLLVAARVARGAARDEKVTEPYRT